MEHILMSELGNTYKIVNGLFSHGFPAQVPNVCNDAGVTDASILSGHPDTASSLCYVAWHVVRFVYDVSVCFVKETLRQGLDRSCSWINQPEDLTSRKLLRVCPGRNPATFRLMAPGCDCWVAAELLDSPHSPVRQRRSYSRPDGVSMRSATFAGKFLIGPGSTENGAGTIATQSCMARPNALRAPCRTSFPPRLQAKRELL